MKTCKSLVVTVFALAFAADAAHASEMAQVPQSAAAQAAAGAILRAERAIIGYVSACASNDAQDLNSVLTEDARIEFALDEPGTYLSIDASSWAGDCAASTHSGDSPQISNLWIFPTLDANALFVQYDVPASTGSMRERQLVLIEMRGDRIVRMVNFSSSTSERGAHAARARLAR
jgi:hypothetical protein